MPNIFFAVVVGLVGTIGVLAAPVQRTRALNVYDSKLEICIRRPPSNSSDYALVRRGVVHLTKPPGQLEYATSTGCPYNCPDQHDKFTNAGAVDTHLIKKHGGRIPPEWVEPHTVGTDHGGRIYGTGENPQPSAAREKVVCTHPQAAAHLKAQRIEQCRPTAHMRWGSFMSLGAPDRQETGRLEALQTTLDQRRRTNLTCVALQEAERREARRVALNRRRQARATQNFQAAKRLKDQAARRAKHYQDTVAATASQDSKLPARLRAARLATRLAYNQRRLLVAPTTSPRHGHRYTKW